MKIAIAAATGNIGSKVARQIAAQGATAVLLGQNADRLNALNISGAIAAVADISHTDQVVSATQGADALLWLVPPVATTPSLHQWYQKITDAGVAAVKQNQIKRVVLISSLGAGAAPGLGTVSYCGEMEVAFDRLDANVLALRPGYFMENFVLQASSIKNNGEFSFTYDGEHDIPFISTDDIGDAAAKYLLNDSWAGHWKLNLMGPENITPNEAAKRLTALTGKRIRYRQQTMQEAGAQLAGYGLTETVQQELLDLFRALGDPNGAYATPRTPEASTPTTFNRFVAEKLLPVL